jgi:hypothetical protein
MNQKTWAAAALMFALGGFSAGCQSGGVGDPCTPEDEYQKYFSGYAETEVNIESRSFQCETRLCLVNHFRGRVSCPYGQLDAKIKAAPAGQDAPDESSFCHIPGTTGFANRIQVQVSPQVLKRRPNDAVYCSCRCNGSDANGRYCKCPSGYQCSQLLDKVDELGSPELAGSYCIKDGTAYDKSTGSPCSIDDANCGPSNTP